ncbi:hypothetical protein QTP88_001779 [Uroleucon formosanum]
MSNSKLSGVQRRKLQKEKDDKHNNVMTKVKKLDHFFNVLPSNVSKTSKSNEAAPSSTSSVTESDDSNVKDFRKTLIHFCSSSTLDENLTDNYSSANKFIISSLNDSAKWPIIDSETIDFIIRNLSNEDIDKLDFSTSKRLYSSQARYVTRSMFFTKLKNGEMRKREWLIYSESKGSLFCKSCKLFQSTPNTFTQGFNDWKNSDRLYEHERGHDHRVNTNNALTGRWSVLLGHIENSNDTILLPKSLSQTRWSARSDACRALLCGYELFYEALKEISLNPSEKPATKVEALGLCKSFNNKTLQKVTINLCDVVLLYKSLLNYVNELRDRFDDYERKRNISKRLGKYIENDVILEGKEAMKINTFFVIIDKLVLELSERSKAYTEIDSLFNFFSDLLFICPKILKERTKRLVEKYSNDLEDELYEECLHFKQFLNEIEIEESDKKSPSIANSELLESMNFNDK